MGPAHKKLTAPAGERSWTVPDKLGPAFGRSQEVLEVLPGFAGVSRVLVRRPEQAQVAADLGKVVPEPVQRQGLFIDLCSGRGCVALQQRPVVIGQVP